MRIGALLLTGAVLAVTAARLAANNSVREESSSTYALRAGGSVSLENANGDVRIQAWDRDEVLVEAIKTGNTAGVLEQSQIEVDSRPESLSIRARYAGDPAASPGRVDFVIRVPRAARLDGIKLLNGGLDIDGVTGEVNASSVNGSVRARRIAGDARLSTVNGKLEATFDRLGCARMISMASVNGSIRLAIPVDARAEFNARNVTGGIANQFGLPVRRSRTAAGNQLHGVLKGGRTRIELNNINGQISIVPVSRSRQVPIT